MICVANPRLILLVVSQILKPLEIELGRHGIVAVQGSADQDVAPGQTGILAARRCRGCGIVPFWDHLSVDPSRPCSSRWLISCPPLEISVEYRALQTEKIHVLVLHAPLVPCAGGPVLTVDGTPYNTNAHRMAVGSEVHMLARTAVRSRARPDERRDPRIAAGLAGPAWNMSMLASLHRKLIVQQVRGSRRW